MKTKYAVYASVFILLIIASCKKNSSTPSGSIQGTWNFEFEQVKGQSTIEYTVGGTDYKTVTVSNYTTSNNSGGLNITANMMNAIGLTYSIVDTAIGYNYENGTFVDSAVQIVTDYIAPINSSSSYILVGSDSVYFPSGGFTTPAGYQATGASGARINVSGDTLLTMTTSFVKDSSIFIYGVPATAHYQATLISKFN